VAFFGGVVLYTRFFAAGVPADEAIAHVPRADLIGSGAAFIVPALLTALAAVTAMAIVDVALRGRESHRRADDALTGANQALEQRTAEEEAALTARDAERKAVAALSGEPPIVLQTAKSWRETRQQASKRLAAAERAYVKAQAATHEAERQRTTAERAVQKSEHVVRRRALGGVVLLFGEFLIILPALDVLDQLRDWLLVGVAVFLTIFGSIVVGARTRKFTWFALTAFVAVGLFVAIATYERTVNDPKVSPVALIHDGDIPAYGFFVTSTDDRVYIAQPQRRVKAETVQLNDNGNRLLEFKRDKVTDLQIGPLIKTENAYLRSLQLARDICTVPPARAKQAGWKAKKKKAKKDAEDKGTDAKKVKVAAKKPQPQCHPGRLRALKRELATVRKLDAAERKARRLLRKH
jgi:hypothetical protein